MALKQLEGGQREAELERLEKMETQNRELEQALASMGEAL
jgi:hypothetical protein